MGAAIGGLRDKLVGQGDMVAVSQWIVFRHEGLWERPGEIDPEPFCSGAGLVSARNAYRPFGLGPRSCPGAAFATQECLLILAQVVRRFHFQLVPNHTPMPVAWLTLRPRYRKTAAPAASRIIRVMIGNFFRRLRSINRLFLLAVVLPTSLSAVYFGLIASDIFISESRFVMRSPQKQGMSGLGAILQGVGFSRSQDDTYTVHDYILSRDALKELEKQFALSKAFGGSHVDIFSRFAGIDPENSFEALHRYYQKRVSLEVDNVSSITVLRASAFNAADAHRINEKLMELSEQLVNQLNERGRQDMIRFAAAEVAVAEQNARSATLAVSNFRTQKAVFDPERQSALQLQLVSKLQDELIATKTQLAQIRELTKDNPQIPSLQKRLDVLQGEINSETSKVAGGDRSLSSKSADYERLTLDRAFADKQLAAALTSLELARNEAQRKQLYLERVVQPSLPDVAVEPRRLRNVLSTFVLGLAAWGILSMLLAGVREHQD